MTFSQDLSNMSVGYIAVTVFIAGQIVEVADISIIGNSVIKLNHRIFRLNDGQLREMSNGCFIFFINHGTGKTIGSHQATGRYITAILINTSHFHKVSNQRTVSFHINTSNTKVSDSRTRCEQSLPVDQCATIDNKAISINRTL